MAFDISRCEIQATINGNHYHHTITLFIATKSSNMVRTTLLALLVGIIFQISCNPEEPTPVILKISVKEDSPETISLHSFIKNSELIQLEYSRESAVGKIEILRYLNDKIYVLSPPEGMDKRDLVIFRKNGEFFKRINAGEEGPGSFHAATDIVLNEDGSFEVLDRNRSRIVHYNPNGTFIRNTPVHCSGIRIISRPVGQYWLYRGFTYAFTEPQNIPFNLAQVDPDGNCNPVNVMWMNPILRDRTIDAGDFFFQNHYNKSEWLLCDAFNDTIFIVNGPYCKPGFVLERAGDKKNQTKIKLAADNQERHAGTDFNLLLLELLNDPSIVVKYDLITHLSPDKLLISYRRNSKRYFVTMNIHSGSSHTYTTDTNLLDNWFIFQWDAGRIAIVIDSPLTLSEQLKQNHKTRQLLPKKWQDLFLRLTTDVNPFILVVNAKNLFE